MITLLDYGAGNVRSVINAIEKLGETVRIVAAPHDILAAERLVFPGVGNFGSMMRVLREKDYVGALTDYLAQDRPFLGICLGLQALFEKSEEAPGTGGLGIIAGAVRRFDTELAVPHMGWNGIRIHQEAEIFHHLSGEEKFYFVHSYHVVPDNPAVVLTETTYGETFVSAVRSGNIVATQFHPEKSGAAGLTVLQNFIRPEAGQPASIRCGTKTHLAKRIVACLDVRANDAGDLVVTKGDRYDVREKGEVRNLGKPVALARRYYEEGADEITFLNITGFRDFPLKDLPMLEVLRQSSRHVFVPLTIGGGIQNYTDPSGRHHTALEVAAEYFRSGADKISIGSDAVLIVEAYLATGKKTGKSAIEQISSIYGNQAVVVSIDPRRVYVNSPQGYAQHVVKTSLPGPKGEPYCWFQCTIKGGREGRPVDAVTLAKACEKLGAGEILLNSIDRDGTHAGFDIELINAVAEAVSIPVIASSGAGSEAHFLDVFTRTGAQAALAAGIFHRRKVPISAVKQYLAAEVAVRL
ncbi:MAG: imidazole glycerol phosphate synthase subunit HisF [Desulfobacterales bacterium]|nr:imidazole glycerol phosphate synthase subunit HisF [Desulfobacterales bacterium]